MHFDELKLAEAVLRSVRAEGYDIPTPIQQKAIPHVLEGKDLMGCAQTGTGKTAAFALPILSRLCESPAGHTGSRGVGHAHEGGHSRRSQGGYGFRVLVLTPTRELAVQIGESFSTYGRYTGVRVGLIFGGVGQGGQEQMLRAGVDVVVATPGRFMDLMNQRLVDLSGVEVFVLDEADRMLDMGFIADIRKILAKLPLKRQNLMFSATMPPEIKRLADGILHHPVHVAVAPVSSTAERVRQSVYHVDRRVKSSLLLHLLKTDESIQRVLIFTRTKHGADRLAKGLNANRVPAEAIHGNKSQNQRQRALDGFKSGRQRVLVATDIAARGLDIEMVTHVINYELPNIPESYVHRIGRTARAGESGVAISFCDPEEREFLRDIERVIATKVPVEVVPSSLEPLPQRRDVGPGASHRPGGPRGHGHPQGQSSRRPQGGNRGPGRGPSQGPSQGALRLSGSSGQVVRPNAGGGTSGGPARPAASPKSGTGGNGGFRRPGGAGGRGGPSGRRPFAR